MSDILIFIVHMWSRWIGNESSFQMIPHTCMCVQYFISYKSFYVWIQLYYTHFNPFVSIGPISFTTSNYWSLHFKICIQLQKNSEIQTTSSWTLFNGTSIYSYYYWIACPSLGCKPQCIQCCCTCILIKATLCTPSIATVLHTNEV